MTRVHDPFIAPYDPIARDLVDRVPDSEAERQERTILISLTVAFLVEMGLIGWFVWHVCKTKGWL